MANRFSVGAILAQDDNTDIENQVPALKPWDCCPRRELTSGIVAVFSQNGFGRVWSEMPISPGRRVGDLPGRLHLGRGTHLRGF